MVTKININKPNKEYEWEEEEKEEEKRKKDTGSIIFACLSISANRYA